MKGKLTLILTDFCFGHIAFVIPVTSENIDKKNGSVANNFNGLGFSCILMHAVCTILCGELECTISKLPDQEFTNAIDYHLFKKSWCL